MLDTGQAARREIYSSRLASCSWGPMAELTRAAQPRLQDRCPTYSGSWTQRSRLSCRARRGRSFDESGDEGTELLSGQLALRSFFNVHPQGLLEDGSHGGIEVSFAPHCSLAHRVTSAPFCVPFHAQRCRPRIAPAVSSAQRLGDPMHSRPPDHMDYPR